MQILETYWEIKFMSNLLRTLQVAQKLGISRSTLLRREKEGALPRRVYISNRISGWLDTDIEAFLEERAANSKKTPENGALLKPVTKRGQFKDNKCRRSV